MRSRCAIALVLVGCGGTSDPRPVTFGGDRPVDLQIPASFDESRTYPLVVVLHGYGATGFIQESVFGLKAEVTAGHAFVLAPDGLVDSMNHPFWNADPECCDKDHRNPDDVGYIGGLIDAVKAAYPIDRVVLFGHSNGGYMSYRMACDRADVIDNIVVLAGNAASDPSTCHPARPVEVLHLHGDQDTEVPYAATAMRSAELWAGWDGCGTTLTPGPTHDLDGVQPGAETTTQVVDGCPKGLDVELWTLTGAGHVPSFNAMAEPVLYQWFLDHPRP